MEYLEAVSGLDKGRVAADVLRAAWDTA